MQQRKVDFMLEIGPEYNRRMDKRWQEAIREGPGRWTAC
jgi:hypothetical protein